MAEMRGAYVPLVGKREGKYETAKPRWRWEDNIKINFQVI
jgi:hypothetical protein